MAGLGARKVAVYTDPHLASLPPVQQVLDSLVRNKVSIRSIAARASCNQCNLNLFNKVNFVLYDEVRVEPTDQSFVAAADFAKREQGRSYFYISSVVCIYIISSQYSVVHGPRHYFQVVHCRLTRSWRWAAGR